jgi:RNA polymerase sigma-70 factor (ECF subfamily)
MTQDLFNPIGSLNRSSDRSKGTGESARFTAAEDQTLVDRVRSKDEKAMAELFDRYGSMVYSVALRVLKDPGNAEDVMQEVFFKLWQSPQTFVQSRGSLAAWLLVVARNRAVDVLRRRRTSVAVEDVVLVAATNVAADAERRTMMEKVRFALDQLPPEQQKSMEMAFFEGLSHSEIAAQTGDALGTVKTRIRTALMSVRKAFQA